MQFALGSLDTSVDMTLEVKSQQHCGIPEVHFLGTLTDWKNLRRKITYLDRYAFHKQLDVILPIINKFILAIQTGEADKAFWDSAYTVVPAQTVTSQNKVHGWVCNFFPYVGTQLKDQFGHMGGMKKLFRQRGTKVQTFMIDESDFHRGIQISLVTINTKEYTLASGFVGVEIEKEVNPEKDPADLYQTVKAAVGWYLYEVDPKKQGSHPNVFVSAETSGSLF